MKQIKFLVDYIFPPRCLSCSTFTSEADGFCHACWNSFNFITQPYCKLCGCQLPLSIQDDIYCGKCCHKLPFFNTARSLMKFDEHSKKLIHHFKYYDKTHLAKTFARLIFQRYKPDIQEADLIAPVPMHKLKRLVRMYNQAQILSVEIAKITRITLKSDLLIKFKWTKPQTLLSRAKREVNIANSIKINKKYSVKDKKILLIDDVLTTGTTIALCSKILKEAGAAEISVITIART